MNESRTQESSGGKDVVVVTIFDESYLPGFLALLQSLSEAEPSSKLSKVIAYNDTPGRPSSRRLEKAFGNFEIEYRSRSDLGEVDVSPSTVVRPKNLAKLALFGIEADQEVAYFDCDMLFVGRRLSAITELRHFSAAPNWGRREPEEVDGKPMFNSGFMVYRPSSELFSRILEYARSSERSFPYGDQGILNYYFHHNAPSELRYLDLRWNTMITLQNRFPEKYSEIEPQVLHLTGIKPWRHFRRRPSGGRSHPKYEHEVSLWWGYYRRAMRSLMTGRPTRTV